MVIDSNFSILWSHTIGQVEKDFLNSVLSPFFITYTGWSHLKRIITILVAFVFSGLPNPLVAIMQYLLGFVDVTKFLGIHASTPVCDSASPDGNFDTFAAVVCSIAAWFLIQPIIYVVASVVTPGMPKRDILKCMELSHENDDLIKKSQLDRDELTDNTDGAYKYISIIAADLWLLKIYYFAISNLGNNFNRTGSTGDSIGGSNGRSSETEEDKKIGKKKGLLKMSMRLTLILMAIKIEYYSVISVNGPIMKMNFGNNDN